MTLCEICGEGNTHLRCEIEHCRINTHELSFCEAREAVFVDIPLYFDVCDTCGIESLTTVQMQLNKMVYVLARREHGLPDSAFKRGLKDEKYFKN